MRYYNGRSGVQLLESNFRFRCYRTPVTWAKRLNTLLRRRSADSLDDVLAAAAGTSFARFAASLRRDFDAISAALVTPWTTGPVEGQISRLKMLKRTIYGRAGFELLRARVLSQP